MAQEKKIYCGSGKKKSDTWIQVTINPEKFGQYIQEFNGNKFLKLNINIKKELDKFGKDIEVSIDTWKPDANKQINGTVVKQEEDNSLPF